MAVENVREARGVLMSKEKECSRSSTDGEQTSQQRKISSSPCLINMVIVTEDEMSGGESTSSLSAEELAACEALQMLKR